MERSGVKCSPFDTSRANQNLSFAPNPACPPNTPLPRSNSGPRAMNGGGSSHMEGMDDGGGTPTMNGGFAGRERTERRLIASRFPSPLRLFGVDVNGVRDELGSLGVGVNRSNPGLHGSSPRVSPPTLHEALRDVQRPEAGSLLGAQQSRLAQARQQADAFLRLRGVMDTPAR